MKLIVGPLLLAAACWTLDALWRVWPLVLVAAVAIVVDDCRRHGWRR